MQEEKMIEMLDRIEFVGGCDVHDLVAIATADFTDYEDKTVERMENILFKTLHQHGERISEAEDWKDSLNPHKEGYRLENYNFWTYYTGCAGRYWGCHLALVNDYTLWDDLVGLTLKDAAAKRRKELKEMDHIDSILLESEELLGLE